MFFCIAFQRLSFIIILVQCMTRLQSMTTPVSTQGMQYIQQQLDEFILKENATTSVFACYGV